VDKEERNNTNLGKEGKCEGEGKEEGTGEKILKLYDLS
jgi:hypothetical protein